MANQISRQVLNDGPRNFTLKLSILLDTSDLVDYVVADPALMETMDLGINRRPLNLRLESIEYNVGIDKTAVLYWQAIPNIILLAMSGNGELLEERAGLISNPNPGATGRVLLSTGGLTPGSTHAINLIINFIKVSRPPVPPV